MDEIAVIVSFLAIIGFIIGIFFPETSLCWYTGKKTRLKSCKLYGAILILAFIIFALLEATTTIS
ncbi:hypothetical protein [uncultured Pontibacter sp.]|uniref:hypothetical protein n=1 Tax=uncultured Pontibacter sp. TaxID=453356 RepID=UPI0026107E74|nr:hypothetical protein [uncultured Pontibacter sp.]